MGSYVWSIISRILAIYSHMQIWSSSEWWFICLFVSTLHVKSSLFREGIAMICVWWSKFLWSCIVLGLFLYILHVLNFSWSFSLQLLANFLCYRSIITISSFYYLNMFLFHDVVHIWSLFIICYMLTAIFSIEQKDWSVFYLISIS